MLCVILLHMLCLIARTRNFFLSVNEQIHFNCDDCVSNFVGVPDQLWLSTTCVLAMGGCRTYGHILVYRLYFRDS